MMTDEEAPSIRRLLAGLESLPDPVRVTIVLRYVRDLSYTDIARLTDVSVETALARGSEGLRLLSESLLGNGQS